MRFWLIPDDCPGLLREIMQYFQGDGSFISLEGALSKSLLDTLQDSRTAETQLLRRNTSSPPLDFVIAPLSAHNIKLIRQAIDDDGLSEDSGIIHVQIASGGRLVFGAYDNFHPNCIFLDGMPAQQLASLIEGGVLVSFTPDDA